MEHNPRDDSLIELIASLARDIPELFEREIRLAKADAALILDMLMAALAQFAIGSVVGIGAVAVLLAAVVSGIAAVFVAMGMELALAGCAAAGIVAVLAGLVAWALFANALGTMKRARASLEGSVETLAFRAPRTEET